MDPNTFHLNCIVHKTGWLYKAPPIIKIDGFKSFKKRYFMILQMKPDSTTLLKKGPKKGARGMEKLHEFYLMYWARDNIRQQPMRAIPILEGYHVDKFLLYENKIEHMITLNTKDRIYFLAAPSEIEMNSWYEQLEKVLNYVKNRSAYSPRTDTDECRNADVMLNLWGDRDSATTSSSILISHRQSSFSESNSSSFSTGNLTQLNDYMRPAQSTGHIGNEQFVASTALSLDGMKLARCLTESAQIMLQPRLSVMSFPARRCLSESSLSQCTYTDEGARKLREFKTNADENTSQVQVYSLFLSQEEPILTLFDTQVKLPHTSEAVSTKDGIQITYGEYEINLKKR